MEAVFEWRTVKSRAKARAKAKGIMQSETTAANSSESLRRRTEILVQGAEKVCVETRKQRRSG